MKIAFLSSYLPRECGIATFNSNLTEAIKLNLRAKRTAEDDFVVAINDTDDLREYKYGPEVQFVIRQENQEDYLKAAEYINNSNADVCILQHEFGIFGGQSGIYVLPLLHRLEKPVVSVLHTVLNEPSYLQKIITREIARESAKLVVMNNKAIDFLRSGYDISGEKLVLIEHGVPDLEAEKINPVRNLPHFRNKRVLLTFGLINRNKGLETVIHALPAIVEKHPDVIYMVLGNTHPGILKVYGEEYRDYLKLLAERLHVEKNLVFINRFVSEQDLVNYLGAAEIYISPYLNEAQIASGTLSYAVGAGAAVVSTPYWHAQELLDQNRGKLFDFKDAMGLARTVNFLLDNPDELNELKKNAYQYGKRLRWPRIGNEYAYLLNEAANMPAGEEKLIRQVVNPEMMPKFSLTHAIRLTDDTGIIQHAKYGIPNLKEGYCLDDNSRALIMVIMAYRQKKNQDAYRLLPIYLSFIHYMQRDDGNFRNFLSFDRRYLDKTGSEDSFGRTIWALGYLIRYAPNNSYREFAEELFFNSVKHFRDLKYIRGYANTIIGVAQFLKARPLNEEMLDVLKDLTSRLVKEYENHADDKWHWFEDKLSYDNAIIPLALLHSFEITRSKKVKKVALASMKFLEELTFRNGYPNPIGNEGWLVREKTNSGFAQQAIDIMGMVLMYFHAFEVGGNPEFLRKMFDSYLWFLGENALRVPLYDYETKGCCDGLESNGINRNQGAESTLAYLISHLTVMEAFEKEYKTNQVQQTVEAVS
jgi:glycosyltransferase involved in cell wall biosynthesis